MLFNSKLFIFGFLPVALLGFCLAGRFARAWVLGCSLVFYAWWRPMMVWLLIGSVLVNFGLGRVVTGRRGWLVAGLAFNLGLLGFFKYAGLFLGITGVVLPLGVSFFTFQQIMFLVDRWGGALGATGFLDYACFVGFFPHLIAGPIVRPGDIIPQFARLRAGPDFWPRLGGGGEIFLLGLAKKLVLADGLARFADPGFAAAAMGARVSLIEAWVALLAYALQIYFDFSGYSDMAIGLAQMFGIRFPLNFNSPYQARDIGDFWRRWNISLSRFLRDYLYIPLGGNRTGEMRRVVNVMITMLLGGLWHGAAWKFMLWGGLHGVYLVVHGWWDRMGVRLPRRLAWALTLLAVLLAWVPFRSANFAAATMFYRGLCGANGLAVPELAARLAPWLGYIGHVVPVLPYLGDARSVSLPEGCLMLALGWWIVLCLPELHSMNAARRGVALVAGFALTMQALFLAPYTVPFLYFQF